MSQNREEKLKNTKGKKGKPPPIWLVNLPVGVYTAKQLEELSMTGNRSVRKVMTLHGALVEYKFNGQAIEGIYKWDGFKK